MQEFILNAIAALLGAFTAVAKSMLYAASRLASDVRQTLRLRNLGDGKRLYDDESLEALVGSSDLSALERAKHIDGFEDVQ